MSNRTFYDVLRDKGNFYLEKNSIDFKKADVYNFGNRDNFFIKLKDSFFEGNKIDLSNESLTLCCITSRNILFSVLSYLSFLKYIKFTRSIFLTDCCDYKCFDVLKDLGVDVIRIDKIDLRGYNVFRLFGIQDYVSTNFSLYVEHDGSIYNPNLWKDDFLKYDYIGGVWSKRFYDKSNEDFDRTAMVGNSGISIMSKKFLDVLITRKKDFLPYLNIYTNCDSIFCRSIGCNKILNEENIKKAPPELAAVFSFEAPNENNKNIFDVFAFHLTGDKKLAHEFILGRSSEFLEIIYL